MKNLKQVNLIQTALNKERDKLLMDLSQINIYMRKKIDSLNRVIAYQKEYSEGSHLNVTRMIPALHKNLDFFSGKIQNIIITEEKEIENLSEAQKSKLKQIEVVDQKIKLMSSFSESILAEMALKADNMEQLSIDDLSATKQSRGEYE